MKYPYIKIKFNFLKKEKFNIIVNCDVFASGLGPHYGMVRFRFRRKHITYPCSSKILLNL